MNCLLISLGDTVEGFRDLSIAFVTLWRMMLGDGDMESLVAADPYFGYILYILYTFLAGGRISFFLPVQFGSY